MSTAWQAYLNLLPQWLREPIDKQGRDALIELRLRIAHPPELCFKAKSIYLDRSVTLSDIQFVINAATKYSPWTSSTVKYGFITAEGGHRIGVCGDTVLDSSGLIATIRTPSSLNLRVARDITGIAAQIGHYDKSILIIGRPGCGKTTLLRDYIRQRAEQAAGSVCVIDERREIFPQIRGKNCFFPGKRTDVLSGCGKAHGIDNLLRCMNPDTIAVDEITAEDDCDAMINAGWCGVKLIATAHAETKRDLLSRPIYKPIVKSGIFQLLITMTMDNHWRMERMDHIC